MKKNMDYIKANRKASREIEMDDETGWTAKNKPHKMKTDYKRSKYKKIDINQEI
jgi:hypothetical protein